MRNKDLIIRKLQEAVRAMPIIKDIKIWKPDKKGYLEVGFIDYEGQKTRYAIWCAHYGLTDEQQGVCPKCGQPYREEA